MDLILNSRTEKKLEALQDNLPQGLLLTGEKGVGLATLAKNIAGKDSILLIEPADSKGSGNHDTGTISVEAVRLLYEQTRGKASSRQIVLIDDAHRMSLGAQAAFLKLLEEPPENTHFILTSHAPQDILPTILSRVQTIVAEPISETQTTRLIESMGIPDAKMRTQLEYLALGLPAELYRLQRDTEYFKQRAEVMGDTRVFLTGTMFEKLLIVHKYYQDRTESIRLIDSCLIVSERSNRHRPGPLLIAQLEKLLRIREKIENNCNIRLQLTHFAVDL